MRSCRLRHLRRSVQPRTQPSYPTVGREKGLHGYENILPGDMRPGCKAEVGSVEEELQSSVTQGICVYPAILL